MRTKEFLMRLVVVLPMAIWGVFLFSMLLGIAAYFMGATPLFYCTIYCKVGLGLFAMVTLAVVYCQANACLKKGSKEKIQL